MPVKVPIIIKSPVATNTVKSEDVLNGVTIETDKVPLFISIICPIVIVENHDPVSLT